MEKPPTIADVARLAGVHKATASRALNPRTAGQVNTATARRVVAAAKRLRYQPNTLARSLSTNRSATVGVLIPDLTNPLFPLILRGVEDVLSPNGYTALLANTDNDADREQAQFEALSSRQVDGFIMATARRTHPLLERAHAQGTTIVLVNRTTDAPLFPVVTGSDADGVAAAVDHLVRLGHRRIAHLAGPQSMSTGVARALAFQQAAALHGLSAADAPVIEASAYTEEAGLAAIAPLLARDPRPTAVLAGNDMIALGMLQGLRERGLSCPRDLSVIGFNDMKFVDKLTPALTTVRVPHHRLGVEAAQLLLEQLGTPDRSPKVVSLPVRLVVRESTGPA